MGTIFTATPYVSGYYWVRFKDSEGPEEICYFDVEDDNTIQRIGSGEEFSPDDIKEWVGRV